MGTSILAPCPWELSMMWLYKHICVLKKALLPQHTHTHTQFRMLTFYILFRETQAQMRTTPSEWQGTYALTRIKQGSKTMAGWSNWCCLKIQRPLLNGATHISMNQPDWLLSGNMSGPPCKDSQLQWRRSKGKTALKIPFWEWICTQTSTQSLVRWLISFKVKDDSKIKCQWWNFRPFLLIVCGNGIRSRHSQSRRGAQLWFFLSRRGDIRCFI